MAPYDRPFVVILDDTDSRFKYSGTWNRTSRDDRVGNNGVVFNETICRTYDEKASVEVEFEGKYIAFMGSLFFSDKEKAPKYKCIVDEKTDISPENNLKLGRANNEILCESGILEEGKHTAKLSIESLATDFKQKVPLDFDYVLYEPITYANLTGTTQRIYSHDSRVKLSPNGWTKIKNGRNGDQWSMNDNGEQLKDPGISLTFEGDTLVLYTVDPERPVNENYSFNDVTYTLDGGPERKFSVASGPGSRNYNQIGVNFTDLSHTNHTFVITGSRPDKKSGKKLPFTLSFFDIRGTFAPPANAKYDTPSTSSSTDSAKKGANVGVGVGATLGALAGLAIIIWAVAAFRAKRKGQMEEGISLKQGMFFKGGARVGGDGRYERVREQEHQAWSA